MGVTLRGVSLREVTLQGGKCLGGKCPGGKCPGGNSPGGKYPGGKCPGGNCPSTSCVPLYCLRTLIYSCVPQVLFMSSNSCVPPILIVYSHILLCVLSYTPLQSFPCPYTPSVFSYTSGVLQSSPCQLNSCVPPILLVYSHIPSSGSPPHVHQIVVYPLYCLCTLIYSCVPQSSSSH